MSRKPHFVLPGVPQHVIQRGQNREPCFFADEDYSRYLHDLHEAVLKNQLQIHAYVLMTNHVHLLVTPEKPFSVMYTVQDLGRKFVRYIEMNPVRAGMEEHPGEYR